MTDETSSLPLPDSAHSAAIDDVNRWRGHCIECFARIDEAAAKALEAMASDKPDANIKTPHLFGQRIAALRMALEGKPVAAKAGPILKALDQLRPILDQRNTIVHATGSVWIDAKGRWLWRYCVTPSGRNRTQENGTIDRDEALAMEKQLGPFGRSFCDRLRHFAGH